MPVRYQTKMNAIEAPPRYARFWLVIASWLYVLAFHFAYVNYLVIEWAYWGFTYRPPETTEIVLTGFLVTVGAVLMPTMLTRGSSIVLLLLYQMVYLPIVLVTLSLDKDRVGLYGEALAALVIAFGIACIAVRRKDRIVSTPTRTPDRIFTNLIVAIWAICFATLMVTYWSVINFAGLGEIYEQRALGAAPNALIGYMQTYLGFVFSPALMTIGLTKRKVWPVLLGLAGCLLMYVIAAQRTVFLLPAGLLALHFLLRRNNPIFRSTALLTLLVAAAVFLSAYFWNQSDLAALICTYLTGRTIAVPGLTFSQYFDLFSSEGFTWWSHIRGIDHFIVPPEKFMDDAFWPRLGNIVGDRVYKTPEVNVNANLYSSDGLAAAGSLGVVVIGVLFAIWLRLIDRVSAQWDRDFVILTMFPVGLALTNVQFSTMLLSFGGLFWLLFFMAWKPSAAVPLGDRPGSVVPPSAAGVR
jgi:hypothetical protein